MTTSRWDKFVLLMWKNWLLQWRHKIQTAVEIFVPVLFSALLVLIRSLVDPDVIPDPTVFKPLPLNKLPDFFNQSNADVDYRLSFSPANPQLYKLISTSASFLGLSGVVEENNSDALERGLFNKNYIAGVEFDDTYSGLSELPSQLKYSLRFPSELRNFSFNGNPLSLNWRTGLLFPLFQTGGPRNPEQDSGGVPVGYLDEAFLQIQNAIAKTFTEIKSGIGFQYPSIMIQRYPYPPYTKDILLQGLESFVSLIILLSFVYPCINLVKFITTEKEKQLKEAMKIMGLPNWLHWLAWFIKAMVFMLISITLIVLLIKIRWYPETDVSVFTYSNWFVLWVLLFVFSITTVMFCFMMSVFFSKANTAAAVTGLVWFIIYAPYTFTEQNYELMTLGEKLLVCLFSNTAMAYAFRAILRFEGTGEGLQWSNLWKPINPDDNFPVGVAILMLLLDAVIYLLIALYVEKINPGEFGVPEKWYFPFTRKFWCGAKEYSGVTDLANHDSQSDDTIESEPLDKYAGVQIKNLRKVYSNKKVAVEGLTLNMYEDQITVLLGHNGAGKTTTMSMLTGMFPPTSGTAILNGKDIRTDIDGVRDSLGLCPQHNILFDELTVREHIIFYSRLKGLEKKEIENEITKYVNLLELQPKINAQSKTLSGGMKRKLSVGVALCGNSKVVLCDEPTSGMDPAARRALWDLLQHEKKGRTLLLSTHFMDEADILGDRIAIMSDGVLRACGTSFFLKKKFGVGYHLICVKSQNTDVRGVTALLNQFIPQISVKTNIGSELSYELSEKYIDRFEEIFKVLESNSHTLGLLGYGVSPTTLEEVFLKVGTDNREEIEHLRGANDNYQILNGSHEFENGTAVNIESKKLLTGSVLALVQILAMFEKKILYTLRNWLLMVIQIIIPVAFLIMTILIVRSWSGGGELPPLDISIDPYLETITVLQRQPDGTDSNIDKISNSYEALFKAQSANHKLDVMYDDNMTQYILNLSEQFLTRINSQYMIGATILPSSIIAWFNNQPYHTAPLAIGKVHNAILRASDCGETCSITITNKPIPYKTESRLKMLQAGNNMGFQLSFNSGFALSFVSAFYVLFYIKERVNRAKLLQFVSGVNVFIYWCTAFIWDYFTFVITSIFAMVTLVIFQEDGFATFEEIGRVFVVWICFGYGFLPVTYLMSMLFSIPSTGFVRGAIYNIFTGIACFSIVFIMAFEGFDLKPVADGLTWFFLFFPHFALSEALSNLNVVNILQKTCSRLPSIINACTFDPRCCVKDYFQWDPPGIGRHIFFLLFVGTLSFIILLIIELRIIETLIYFVKKNNKVVIPPQTENIDEDVMEEKNQVNKAYGTELVEKNLLIKNMTKYYKNFMAVNQLSVSVNSYECFGLLGVNGAGKTSTFKMLTGDEKISYGEAFVRGISLKTSMNKVHQVIGYCPQFDALIEDLTGRETLRMFCLLRGVPYSNIKNVSMQLAKGLNFVKHLDKKVKEYSGGNKRKLSTAVALIGNPIVVYLDEPTTGMDPGAKRQLWNMICKIRDSGKTIILTSHSMEECEALCTKLAIMVNGEFKCIGSSQYLKNKFSKGYLLTIKIMKANFAGDQSFRQDTSNSIFGEIIQEMTNRNGSLTASNITENINNIKKFVQENFDGADLKEEYQGLLTYNINSKALKWSRMFGILQNSRERLNIEDYSISQTSLEQVFLSFTKYQREGNLGDE